MKTKNYSSKGGQISNNEILKNSLVKDVDDFRPINLSAFVPEGVVCELEPIILNPLFKMVEERYGLEIDTLMYICREGEQLWEGKIMSSDALVYCTREVEPEICMERKVDLLDVSQFNFRTVNDIYELTNSGFFSSNHPVNKNITEENSHNLIKLIPIVLLTMNDVTMSFRLDNRIIRELFYDAELILNGDEDRPNTTTEELENELSEKFKEQMEWLDDYFQVDDEDEDDEDNY